MDNAHRKGVPAATKSNSKKANGNDKNSEATPEHDAHQEIMTSGVGGGDTHTEGQEEHSSTTPTGENLENPIDDNGDQ